MLLAGIEVYFLYAKIGAGVAQNFPAYLLLPASKGSVIQLKDQESSGQRIQDQGLGELASRQLGSEEFASVDPGPSPYLRSSEEVQGPEPAEFGPSEL